MSYELEFRNKVVKTQNFASLRYIVFAGKNQGKQQVL